MDVLRLDEAAVEVIHFRRCVIWISPGSCNKTQFTCMTFSYPFFMWHTPCQSEKNSTKSRQSWRWDSESETTQRLECSIFLFYFSFACPWHLAFCLLMTLCCMKCWDVNAVKYKVVLGTANYFIGRIFHGSEMVFDVADDTTKVVDYIF